MSRLDEVTDVCLAGGCDDCDAYQVVIEAYPRVFVWLIAHDDTCPRPTTRSGGADADLRTNERDEQRAEVVNGLLTTKEAAALVGLSPRTLEQYRVRGMGPRYVKTPGKAKRGRYSGLVHYRMEDLLAWRREAS